MQHEEKLRNETECYEETGVQVMEEQNRRHKKRGEIEEGDGLRCVKRVRRDRGGKSVVSNHAPSISMTTRTNNNPLVFSGAGCGSETSLGDQRGWNSPVDVTCPPEATMSTSPAPNNMTQVQGGIQNQLVVGNEDTEYINKSPVGKGTFLEPELGHLNPLQLAKLREILWRNLRRTITIVCQNFPQWAILKKII